MSRRTLELWSALAIVYVVWGSTYLAIKVAVRTLPPLLTAGTRFVGAAFVLAGVLALLGRSLRVARREALAAAGIGVVLLAGGVGLVHVAETRIDSSVAALIAGSVPLQIVVWRTAAGERVSRATMAAAVIGLGGLALVIGPDGLAGGATAVGLLVMLVASISWSAGSFVAPRLRLPSDPFVAAVYEMLGGGLVLLAAGLAAGRGGRESTGRRLQAGPLARVGLPRLLAGRCSPSAPSVAASTHAPISQVVTHQYVNPLVAVALGALILDERPGPATLAGAALIVAAVVVTARHEGRPSRPALRLDCVRREARNSSRSERVRIATGFPARPTSTAPPEPVSSAKTSSTDAAASTVASGGCIATATSSLSASGLRKTRSSRLSLVDRADDVGQLLERLVADDRELRDPVALHQLDRGARPSCGRRRRRDPGTSPSPARTTSHGRRRRAPLEEAVLEHPVVVVELREVRAAAVGEGHQDRRPGAEPLRELERRPRGRAARAAREQPFLPREPARREERVAVGDTDPLVDDGRVHRRRPGVLADPLHEVRVHRMRRRRR